MRVHTKTREVTSSGNQAVAKATIKATPKLFDMFANDTYANKPLAIMRELAANAVDSHNAANKPTEPILISLPTQLNPICRVKDNGIGMAHDFVMTKFMAYTDGSTKDQDDTAIGGFGIGSKSPFAYVEQFTLRVVHEGILSIYTMFKDEDGIPAIGLQDQVTTDEPNGVEVSFPVEIDDIPDFQQAAQDALQYFTPLPIIENGKVDPPEYSYVGNDWCLRKSAGELGVIMGGVRYPVTKENLPYDLQNSDRIGPLLGYGIDITVPIGTCSVAMSREQLSYNDRTTEGITVALNGILDNVIETFATLFDKEETLWEARIKLLQETSEGTNQYYSRYNPRQALLRNNAKYRGEELTVDFQIPQGLGIDRLWTIEPKRNRRGSNCPNARWDEGAAWPLNTMTPARVELFIFDDLPRGAKSRAVSRLRHYVNENCDQEAQIFVVRFLNKKAMKKFNTLMGDLPERLTVKTSDMPLPPKKVRVSSGLERPKVRMFQFNGQNDHGSYGARPSSISPCYARRNSVTEIKDEDQPKTGILAVMENFSLPPKYWRYVDAGVIKHEELHFVNTSDASKLKGWTLMEDEAQKRLDAIVSANPQLPAYKALMEDQFLSEAIGYWQELRDYVPLEEFTSAQSQRPFGRIAGLYEEYVADVPPEVKRVSNLIEAKMPRGVRSRPLSESFEKKQSDLHILLSQLSLNSRTAPVVAKHL